MPATMPAAMPRKYYVVTIRGERGPVDRAELKDLVRDGDARLTDRVRTATGRSLGTVAEALAQVRVKDSVDSEIALAPVASAPASQRMSSRRNVRHSNDAQKLRLAVTILSVVAVITVAGVVWAVSQSSQPAVIVIAAPAPAQPAPPTGLSAAPAPSAPVAPAAQSPTAAPAAAAPIANLPADAATNAAADPTADKDAPPLPVFGTPTDPAQRPNLVSPGDTAPAVTAQTPPAPPAPAPAPKAASDIVMVWDGDALVGGHGWVWPLTPPNRIESQSMVVHNGRNALRFHAEGDRSINAGWQWNTSTTAGVDFPRLHALVVSMKIEGRALPNSAQLVIQGDDTHSKYVELSTLCPALMDGNWHDIVVPFADLEEPDFDFANADRLQIETRADGALAFDMYIDDIGYTKADPNHS